MTTTHVHRIETITGVEVRELDEATDYGYKSTAVRAVGGVHSVHVEHTEHTNKGTDQLVVSLFGADRLTLDPQVHGSSISLRGIDCDVDLYFHDAAAMVAVLRLAADVLEDTAELLTHPDA